MTNEQLASFIQQGGADDLKPVLWERVKHLMYKLAGQRYSRYNERFNACGVELSDIRQECYGAFVKALNAYKTDDEVKFTSYLNYHVINITNDLLGIRNKDRVNKKLLDNSYSLDEPLRGCENDNLTMSDTLVDEASQAGFEKIEDNSEHEQVSKVISCAVDKLPPDMQEVVKAFYYEDKNLRQCGEDIGTSGSYAGQLKAKAIRKLRGDKDIKRLGDELGYTSKRLYSDTYNSFKLTGMTQLERIAIERADLLSEGTRGKLLEHYKERTKLLQEKCKGI